MVKFGKRLEEELIKDGWEDHYIQYKKLKKGRGVQGRGGRGDGAGIREEGQFVVKLTDDDAFEVG